EVVKQYERKLPNADALRKAEVRKEIVDQVRELARPAQGTLESILPEPRVEEIVNGLLNQFADRTISIPQIVVLPKKQITFSFDDFDLENLSAINTRPIDNAIIIHDLRTEARVSLARAQDEPREPRLEDYLVRYLIERNEIDYDAHNALLYKLAGQVVAR